MKNVYLLLSATPNPNVEDEVLEEGNLLLIHIQIAGLNVSIPY